MKTSIIIPVYNEEATIKKVLDVIKAVDIDKEIVIIDDRSTDKTRDILKEINDPQVRIFYHDKNLGKGAALRTGFEKATGDIIMIQDADLEYDPREYPHVLRLIKDGSADVVYGSRFLGDHRVFLFWHYMGNKVLTLITNLLYNTILTDMETGVKAFRREAIADIKIKSNGFDFEPEITAKILKKNLRLYEVPITYRGRGYNEGKKIHWYDGLWALRALIRFRFFD